MQFCKKCERQTNRIENIDGYCALCAPDAFTFCAECQVPWPTAQLSSLDKCAPCTTAWAKA